MNKPYTLHLGDCLDSLRAMPDDSVDSIVTDPPYGLTANKKGGSGVASVNLESPYGRARISTGNGAGGFMGHKWDNDVPSVEIWTECLRVLKPGGHLLSFAGTRTQHRMATRIDDAGFEIRDMIAWVYGSGFPKSRNIANDMDGEDGAAWQGWGTAMKPALEPITVARKPLVGTVAGNVLQHGTGALNIDGCRVATSDDLNGGAYSAERKPSDSEWVKHGGTIHNSTGLAYVQPTGRWPANLIHDGSDEVLAAFPDSNGSGPARALKRGPRDAGGWGMADEPGELRDAGTGSAARFFYCAKASRADRNEGLSSGDAPAVATHATMGECEDADWEARNGNHHPTVKPTDLMAYLVRLVTPPGGVVLDPFMGSGSTGKAALREGFRFIGCEMSPEYLAIARARIEHEVARADAARAAAAEAAKPAPQLKLFA